MVRAIYAWMFLGTQFGILIALSIGGAMLARLSRNLDRDRADRELLRHFLMRESNKARAGVDAVDPARLHDRRDPP